MAGPKARPDHKAEPLTWDHDTTDPKAVTELLTAPFPQEALETKEGFTYVKYPMMIRRLIRATGNRFSVRLVGHETVPFGLTGKGQEKVLIRAWVELDIPVLGSARTHEGVQIAYVGTGEDIYKGAISDAVKKAAQSYGVGIELTGADAEWYIAQREQQAEAPRPAPQPKPPQPTPINGNGPNHNGWLHKFFGHDQLKAWAGEKGYASFADVPPGDVATLRQYLDQKDETEAMKRQSAFTRKYPKEATG